MSEKPTFKDQFTKQSETYAKFRPKYPPEIFRWLGNLSSIKHRVWDCGTGNGQAAVGLAPFFDEVIATDPSAAQISNATPHPKVSYRVEPAEKTTIESGSVDLVTAATAAHWFDLEKFYSEVRRVGKPGSSIAIFAYGHDRNVTPEIDPILYQFGYVELAKYWEPEVQRIWDKYKTIPFPFKEIAAPDIKLEVELNLEQVLGYLGSWSAVQRYINVEGESPLPRVRERLSKIWGDPEKLYKMKWPIYFRVGQIA